MDKIPNIIAGIRKHYPVPDTSIVQLMSHLEEKIYTRGHLLVEAGKKDKHAYFIENGCTRTYFLIKEKDITNWFSSEGDITFSSASLYHRATACEYIEVLETTTIFAISIDQFEQLLRSDIHLANWSRIIHQEVLLKMQSLRMDRLSLTARDRYNKFCVENPNLLNRVNLGQIAFFLGITQQYLSNLRADVRF